MSSHPPPDPVSPDARIGAPREVADLTFDVERPAAHRWTGRRRAVPAQVEDLSVTGLRLALEQPIDVTRGSVLHVRCGAHGGDVRVRHVAEAEGDGRQVLGAEFEQLSPGLRDLVNDRLDGGAEAADWRWSWDGGFVPGTSSVPPSV